MVQRHRGIRAAAALLSALACHCLPAGAQTNDQSRLTMGVSAGWISSLQLWDVPNQPIQSQCALCEPDLWHLHREIRSDISISGQGTYFPKPQLGITGEFTYLGLGTTDACILTHDDGDFELAAACNALQGSQRPASVTTVQGGLILRPLSRTFLQPYVKGMVGLAFTPVSSVEMESVYGQIGDTVLQVTVYRDPDWKPIRPSWAAAFGIATAPSSGYQLRVELRQTWLALSEVTGPRPEGQGLVPPLKSAIKGFTSIMVSFDVVLQKQRGRRY